MHKSASSGAGFGGKLAPGVRVGGAHYVLKRLLGHGEVSEVWLAQDVKNSRPVALKFLPQAFLSDANLLESFKQEAQRNLLLVHPNIAVTHGFVRDQSAAAIVTEFVDGWSLATMKVNKLCRCYTVEEITPWVRQLCAALDYSHGEFGILHGGLKPANLLLSAHDELKITDYGIAQAVRAESSRRGLTKGISNGIGFLSPQQVMGEAPSKADDIYSLGATIFDLLTGMPPFYKGEVIAQICSLAPASMTRRLAELGVQADPIPPGWEAAVARCLAKNPAERPQSGGELLQLIEHPTLPETAETAGAPPEIETEPAVAAGPSEPPGPLAEAPPSQPSQILSNDGSLVISAPLFKKTRPVLVIGGAVAVAVFLMLGVVSYAVIKMQSPGPQSSVRLQAGAPDKSFNPGTGVDDEVQALAIQPDGKILVGGHFSNFNGTPMDGIARLDTQGGLDAAFAPGLDGIVHAIALEADGHILIGGDFTKAGGETHQRIARLNADGTVDANFKAGCNYDVRTILVQPDGYILVGGSFTSVDGRRRARITRLDNTGALDTTFNIGSGSLAGVWALAVQDDGKILVGGTFTQFNGKPAGRLVRLDPDGQRDATFDTGNGADANVFALAIQPGGKILAAGDFLTYDDVPCNGIVRLNSDGRVDPTFNSTNGPNSNVSGLAVQSDGKILIAGGFTKIEGVVCNHLARLNSDGSLDRSFDTTVGADGGALCVALQPDGKSLVGGSFRNYDGTRCGGIMRLNP